MKNHSAKFTPTPLKHSSPYRVNNYKKHNFPFLIMSGGKVWGVIFLIASFAVFLFGTKISLAQSGLIINEIMYDLPLPGTDTNHEWIELFNAGSSEINLTDCKFNDGDSATNHALNAPPKNGSRGSLILAPGTYLILSGNASTTILDLPNYNGSIIDTVMSLNNTAAKLKIFDKGSAEIASASYSKEMGGAGNNKTLEWNGSKFKESTQGEGTPGKENSVLAQSYPAASPPSETNNNPAGTISQNLPPDQSQAQPKVSALTKQVISDAPQQKQDDQVKNQNQSPSTALSADQIDSVIPTDNKNIEANKEPPKPLADSPNSNQNRIYLILGGIIILALVSGLGLIYFKKKVAVDNKQNIG